MLGAKYLRQNLTFNIIYTFIKNMSTKGTVKSHNDRSPYDHKSHNYS